MTTSTTQYSITEERALKLLGSGIGPEVVASACGVSASRISQLLAEPEFLGKVAELRFNNLQKHNETDSTYDDIETKLLGHLKQVLPLIAMKPNELLRAISVINAAKRRGVSAPEQIVAQQTVVNLSMPITLTQKFTTNINNQVIQAGSQTLETIQSSALREKLTSIMEVPTSAIQDVGITNDSQTTNTERTAALATSGA